MKNNTIKNIDDLVEYEFGAINQMATIYILRWVNKKFNPIYWIENNHGQMDYDEMGVLVLKIFQEQLKFFIPLTFENEYYLKAYEKIDKVLKKSVSKNLNTEYIEIHDIELKVIRKDVLSTLKNYFKENGEKGEENVE